ncbi:hypothetical protein PYCC9005_003082 [Savitreella phatthalungensis]
MAAPSPSSSKKDNRPGFTASGSCGTRMCFPAFSTPAAGSFAAASTHSGTPTPASVYAGGTNSPSANVADVDAWTPSTSPSTSPSTIPNTSPSSTIGSTVAAADASGSATPNTSTDGACVASSYDQIAVCKSS